MKYKRHYILSHGNSFTNLSYLILKSYYLRENDSSCLNPENIVLIIIDIYDILSRLEFNIYHLNAYKRCMSYIDQAYKIVQHTSCWEGLHSILRAYYRIGNFYYKSGEY